MSLDKVNEYFEGEPSEEQESLLPLHPEQQTAESSLESDTGEPPRNPAARSVSPMLSRWRGALNPKSAAIMEQVKLLEEANKLNKDMAVESSGL